jgi:hypothetical protein
MQKMRRARAENICPKGENHFPAYRNPLHAKSGGTGHN